MTWQVLCKLWLLIPDRKGWREGGREGSIEETAGASLDGRLVCRGQVDRAIVLAPRSIEETAGASLDGRLVCRGQVDRAIVLAPRCIYQQLGKQALINPDVQVLEGSRSKLR